MHKLPLAARKYTSNRSNSAARNENILRLLKPKSLNYFEPFIADNPTMEHFAYFEFFCNIRKHYKLKSLRRMHKQYANKSCSSQRDIKRYVASTQPVTSDKSKDFFDDATMEYVRHNLFQLSSIDGVVTGGPPAAITFRSKVTGKRKNGAGKVNYLLHWSPENIVPDTWVAEDELVLNLEKTIPVSQLPPEALQLPVMDAFGLSGILTVPGKRKRK